MIGNRSQCLTKGFPERGWVEARHKAHARVQYAGELDSIFLWLYIRLSFAAGKRNPPVAKVQTPHKEANLPCRSTVLDAHQLLALQLEAL